MLVGVKHMRSWQTSSTRRRAKPKTFLFLILLLLGATLLSICFGAVWIEPKSVFRVLFGGERSGVEANIILLTRLPRTCGCLLAGMALAVSGAVIQSVLSNPIAAPNIIGVNSGAGMAVILCTAIAPSALYAVPFAAFAGALLAVVTILIIAEKTGASKITLVLSGVAVTSIFGAITDAIITFVPEALNGYSDFRIGGFANLAFARIAPAFWVILVAFVVLISLSNELDILMLGTDTAQSLGLPARPLRLGTLALAAALAGASVSFSGLLGFVGLIVPHIMRRLVGEGSRELICSCALGGAALVTLCDLLARLLFAPYELPVGIVLSLLGGPFFIVLLIRQRRGRIHD